MLALKSVIVVIHLASGMFAAPPQMSIASFEEATREECLLLNAKARAQLEDLLGAGYVVLGDCVMWPIQGDPA